MRMKRSTILVALALIGFAGCGESPMAPDPATENRLPEEQTADKPEDATKPIDWQVVDDAGLSAGQEQQKQQALKARDALMESLKGRLMEVVSKEGPAAAISVCKDDAPRLAAEISEQHHLRIGRTSFRLRNPKNDPPEWAKPMVDRRVAEPTFLAKGDQLAALLPITTGPLCMTCHGTADGIPEPVRAALAENYANDQATGFEEGDLRGWFWVEVPE